MIAPLKTVTEYILPTKCFIFFSLLLKSLCTKKAGPAGVLSSFMFMNGLVVNGSFVHFAFSWCPGEGVPGEIYLGIVLLH